MCLAFYAYGASQLSQTTFQVLYRHTWYLMGCGSSGPPPPQLSHPTVTVRTRGSAADRAQGRCPAVPGSALKAVWIGTGRRSSVWVGTSLVPWTPHQGLRVNGQRVKEQCLIKQKPHGRDASGPGIISNSSWHSPHYSLFFFFVCAGSSVLHAGFLLLQHTGSRRLRSAASVWGSRVRAQQLPRGMWSLPVLGIEPVSSALAGGFLTTEPSGKSTIPSYCPNNESK